MSAQPPSNGRLTLRLIRYGIVGLNVVNWLFGLTWIALVASGLIQTGGDLSGGRAEFLLQVLLNTFTVVLVHLILRTLARMLGDAEQGQIWADQTPRRLHMVGWALLGIALLSSRGSPIATGAELVVWNALWRLAGDTGLAMSVRPSLTIWLTVPLVFVLANIFREGLRMREELDGTV